MTETVAQLTENLRLQAVGCELLGSPFYAALLELMARDAEAGGPVLTLLGPHVAEAFARRVSDPVARRGAPHGSGGRGAGARRAAS